MARIILKWVFSILIPFLGVLISGRPLQAVVNAVIFCICPWIAAGHVVLILLTDLPADLDNARLVGAINHQTRVMKALAKK